MAGGDSLGCLGCICHFLPCWARSGTLFKVVLGVTGGGIHQLFLSWERAYRRSVPGSVSSGCYRILKYVISTENNVEPVLESCYGKSKIYSSVKLENFLHCLLSLQLFGDLKVMFLILLLSALGGSCRPANFLTSQQINTCCSLCPPRCRHLLSAWPSFSPRPAGPRTLSVGTHFSA